MSTSDRIRITTATAIADTAIGMLADTTPRLETAGSIRRQEKSVGDVELVALHTPELLARLDNLIIAGTIQKATYENHKSFRWGDRYRGFKLSYDGPRIELFVAQPHTWGYIHWLRTGPGDANKFVMSRMYTAPYRFAEGGLIWAANGGQLLNVPDEDALFRFLGMPYIEPPGRSEIAYRRHMAYPRWLNPAQIAANIVPQDDPPQQLAMF